MWTSAELNIEQNLSLPTGEDRRIQQIQRGIQTRLLRTLRNNELFELGETSKTIQRQACLKYSLGVFIMPSLEQRKGIRTQFEVVFVPHHFVRFDYSTSAKYGQSQWQDDHWKAREAKRGATRHKHDSIEIQWKNDDKYHAFQTFHRWAGEYSRYLDPLTPIDISYVATWKQRSRNEKQHCTGRQRRPAAGFYGRKERFSASQLTTLELFNVNKDESFPISSNDSESGTAFFKEKMRSDIQRQSGTWNVHWSHASSSSSTDWWKLGKWHEPQQGEWQHKWC